jgi:radical SAM-linked protein
LRGDAGFPMRIRFAKRGPVRFISHRDVARAFERAFRVAELPVAFTLGFSPRPKVSFGPALAVGYESDAEYLDVECTDDVAGADVAAVVNTALPDGMAVTGIVPLADRAPALQEAITSLAYRVTLDPVADEVLSGAVDALLGRDELPVEVTRKGERAVEDIRPCVLSLTVLTPTSSRGEAPMFELEIATKPRTLRVADVVAGLRTMHEGAATLVEHRVVRTHQWIERGGARREPLDVDTRSPAPERAARALEACA